jgi:hypothetical protein
MLSVVSGATVTFPHFFAGATDPVQTVEVEGWANPDMPKSRILQCMNQASARAGQPRWQYRISRRAAGILLTAGIFAMSFAIARLWSPAVNVTLLTVGFVSLVSGVILTRRLRPRRLVLASPEKGALRHRSPEVTHSPRHQIFSLAETIVATSQLS